MHDKRLWGVFLLAIPLSCPEKAAPGTRKFRFSFWKSGLTIVFWPRKF